MLLADAAVERLVFGVRMDVDEPRHDQALAAVDRHIGWPGETAPDKADPLVGECDVEPAPVDVAAAALVPRDDPGGVLDHGGGHRFRSLRHRWSDGKGIFTGSEEMAETGP